MAVSDFFDDLMKDQAAWRRKNLEQFERTYDDVAKESGGKSFREVMGHERKPADPPIPINQTEFEIVQRLAKMTTDNERNVMTRALKVYQAIVDHAAKGGEVRFVLGDTNKKLTVRLKEPAPTKGERDGNSEE